MNNRDVGGADDYDDDDDDDGDDDGGGDDDCDGGKMNVDIDIYDDNAKRYIH